MNVKKLFFKTRPQLLVCNVEKLLYLKAWCKCEWALCNKNARELTIILFSKIHQPRLVQFITELSEHHRSNTKFWKINK